MDYEEQKAGRRSRGPGSEGYVYVADAGEIREASPLRDIGFGWPVLSLSGRAVDLVLDGAPFLPLCLLSVGLECEK